MMFSQFLLGIGVTGEMIVGVGICGLEIEYDGMECGSHRPVTEASL